MKNVFESMAKALKEFNDENEQDLIIDTQNADDENSVEGEVVKPIVDTELGYESDADDIDISGKSYIGKKVIDCQICGSAFFADELTDDTVCPICTATAEDLLVVGVVAPEDSVPAEPANEPTDNEPIPVADEEDVEDDKPKDEGFNFDEKAMDKLVENFLKENYNDAKSYKTLSTVLTGNNKLRVQGVVETTTGVRKNVVFLTEAISLVENGAKRVKASCPAFSGTRENAFTFEGKLSDKNLVFEKMNYKYTVKYKNESYQVSGKASI